MVKGCLTKMGLVSNYSIRINGNIEGYSILASLINDLVGSLDNDFGLIDVFNQKVVELEELFVLNLEAFFDEEVDFEYSWVGDTPDLLFDLMTVMDVSVDILKLEFFEIDI